MGDCNGDDAESNDGVGEGLAEEKSSKLNLCLGSIKCLSFGDAENLNAGESVGEGTEVGAEFCVGQKDFGL